MSDTILIAMGGQGQRFKDEGLTDPKPRIKVDNQEMFIKCAKAKVLGIRDYNCK